MSDAEVHAAVEAEGLTLVPSANTSGFKGVTSSAGGSSRFRAKCAAAGSSRRHCLGYFGTALQAALAIARFLGPDGSAAAAAAAVTAVAKKKTPLQKGLEEAQILAAVEAEGLTLVPSFRPGSTGFKGVSVLTKGRSNSFQANSPDAAHMYIGTFHSALEAALHVARYLGPGASAAAAAAEVRAAEATTPQGMSDAQVWATAEAEDLTLVRSSNYRSGFMGVGAPAPGGRCRYQAWSEDAHFLGRFDSALEAALQVARAKKAAASASMAAAPRKKRSFAQEGDGVVLVDAAGAQWFEVDCLLDVRQRARSTEREFLVRWLGFQPDDDTWEAECDIDESLVEDFDRGNDRLSAAAVAGATAVRRRLATHGERSVALAAGVTLMSASRGHGMVRKKQRVALVNACSDLSPAWLSAARQEQRIGDCYQARLPVLHSLCPRNDSTADDVVRVCRAALEQNTAQDSAALLTAAAFGLDTFSFVAPCDCGLGLFARVPLRAGQFVIEYNGSF